MNYTFGSVFSSIPLLDQLFSTSLVKHIELYVSITVPRKIGGMSWI